MKKLLLVGCLALSVSAFAQNEKPEENPEKPTGTIAHPTQKQLKSVKKPKKGTAVKPDSATEGTTTPTSTPSH